MNHNYILENDFCKVNKCAHHAIKMRNHINLNWNDILEMLFGSIPRETGYRKQRKNTH